MGPRSIDGIIPPRPTKYIRFSAESAAKARITYAPKPQLAAKRLSPVRPTPKPAKRRKRKSSHSFSFKLAGAFASVVLIAGVIGYSHLSHHTLKQLREAAVPIAHAAASPAPIAVAPTPSVDISADMNAVINAQPGLSASASLVDLDNGATYSAGNTQKYEAASTAKLVTVFAYIHRVELGKATLTQNIGGMSAQENIRRMIIYSDNDAWTRMNLYLTMPGQQAYIQSLGLTGKFQAYDIEFTAADMARLLQMLYSGQLMSAEHRDLVYGYMANTTVKNLIQAALPVGSMVYHKYGQIDGVLHDAAIVEYGGHHFVLVVYTNNAAGTSSKYAQQVSLIHAVTAAAFQDITASQP